MQVDQFNRISCDDYLARMQLVFNTAKENPNSLIYVIIYDGKIIDPSYTKGGDRVFYPTSDSIRAKIGSIRKLMALYKVKTRNIRLVNGGYRDEPVVEVWKVPPGASAPTPTPTVTKMKFRKGRSGGFCTSCCGP